LGLGLASAENLSYQTTLVSYQITLVLYQQIWYHTKGISQGALHAKCLVLLYVIKTSQCVLFTTVRVHLLAFCTLADSVRLIFRIQYLECKLDGH
jgi:hypothetical protein